GRSEIASRLGDPVAFIEVSSISKTFGTGSAARPVLHDASLSVSQGEFVAIVGSMGCGKSTLLNIILGLVPPDAGVGTIGGGGRRGHDRRGDRPEHAAGRLRGVPELLAAAVVLGVGERAARGRRDLSVVAARKTGGAGAPLSGQGGAWQRRGPQAQPAVRRHA